MACRALLNSRPLAVVLRRGGTICPPRRRLRSVAYRVRFWTYRPILDFRLAPGVLSSPSPSPPPLLLAPPRPAPLNESSGLRPAQGGKFVTFL